MTRRRATLLVTTLLTVSLGMGSAQMHVPYVGLGPGPVTNTLGSSEGKPLIEVVGRKTYPTSGHLDLTTVNVYPQLDLGAALRYWFDNELAVVPREVIYPEDQTPEEAEQQNQQQMTESQHDAVTAALRHLKIPVVAKIVVAEVVSGRPAAKAGLKIGDVIVTADGEKIDSADTLREIIRRRPAGETVRLGIARDGSSRNVTVGTTEGADGAPSIGVSLETRNDYPFTINIQLEDVGGPSAGLMFALGIIDMLTPGEMTGGKHIAGTGTITVDGTVGAIGGIQQKLVGARAAGARYFLVPAGNWDEAVAAAQDGLEMYRVATLADALAAIEKIAAA